jgi:6-phosphogluconolactonase
MQKFHAPPKVLAATGAALLTLVVLVGLDASVQAQGLASSGAVFTMTNAADGNAVLAFRRLANGRLHFLDSFPTDGDGAGAGLGNQGGVVLSDDGRYLFAVNAGSDSLSVFAVRPRGLTLLDVEPSGGSGPISVTSDGDLVYVLNGGGDGNIAGFELAPDGSLSPISGSIRPLSEDAPGPAQIAFSPDGRVLVVTEKDTNRVVTYVVGRDGLPSDPIVNPSEGVTPFGFSFGHSGRLFVSEATGGAADASTVSSYDLSRDGTLIPITSALPTTETAACWLVLTGTGRYAYTTNTGSGSVSGLRIARDGTVSLLDADGVTGEAGNSPIDAALSRNSRFLYVLNSTDHTLSAFAVGADGSLTPLPGVSGLPASTNGLAAL